MLFQKVTLLLATAYTACASVPAQAEAPAPTNVLELVDRALSLSKECTSVVLSISPILTSTPTAAYSLSRYMASQTQWTTLSACEVPWVTETSISSEFTSYMSARSSWQSSHKSEISKFMSACGDDLVELGESAGVDLSEFTQTCDEYLWATSTARPTSSNSNNNNNKDKNESDKGSAASNLIVGSVGAGLAAGVAFVAML